MLFKHRAIFFHIGNDHERNGGENDDKSNRIGSKCAIEEIIGKTCYQVGQRNGTGKNEKSRLVRLSICSERNFTGDKCADQIDVGQDEQSNIRTRLERLNDSRLNCVRISSSGKS